MKKNTHVKSRAMLICIFYHYKLFTVNLQTNRTNPDGSMEKVRKLLQSPGSRRKITTNARKTFGISLEELVQLAPAGTNVPFLISRLCEHIQSKGNSSLCCKLCLASGVDQLLF